MCIGGSGRPWSDRPGSWMDAHPLAALREVHTATGKHGVDSVAFPKWVPSGVRRAAVKLTAQQAVEALQGAGIRRSISAGRGR
jgi:hypothetical protein